MRIVVHRSICVLERRTYQIRWAEYDFAPMSYEDRADSGTREGWRHYRMPSVAVAVEAPVGSKVVTVHRPETSRRTGGEERRLAVWWEPYRAPHGIDPETVASLAKRGERGFRVIGRAEDMARKAADGQRWLLRPGPEGIAQGAREDAAVVPPSGVPAPPRELEEAVRRALFQLKSATERDELARVETAKAILENALSGAA